MGGTAGFFVLSLFVLGQDFFVFIRKSKKKVCFKQILHFVQNDKIVFGLAASPVESSDRRILLYDTVII